MKVVADAEIFQHTRACLGSHRLKRPVAVAQGRPDQLSAKGILLHDHREIEQTIMIKVCHFELVRRCSTNDRRSERKISVSWKYAHSI